MLSQIGKYQVEAIIGKGGFGEVYRALDPTIPRHVAIKIVTALEDRSMLARFRVEAGTTGSLQHKNIVTLYDFGEFESTPFLVMELLEGESLFELLQRGHRFTIYRAVDVMSQVAEGLRCAHRRGIIHRDIKPANVMLLPDGTAKIMDFGISLLTTRNITRQTQVGFMVGTLAYMAPELLEGRSDANIQTDIFAFGALFYEILTGVHPFSTGDQVTTMYRLVHAEPTPVSELVPACPAVLETIVQRALTKIPEFRYQSLDDALVDLKPVLDEMKKSEASDLLAAAHTNLTEGNLDRAQTLLRESLELHPGNAQARQLREALQERVRENAVRSRLRHLIEQGDAKLSGGSYSDALQIYEAAFQLSQSGRTIRLHLDDARLITEARKRIAQLLVEAAAQLSQGRLDEALERAKIAAAADPANGASRRLVAEIEGKLRQRDDELLKQGVYRHAEELCSLGQFDQALAELNRIEPESGASARFSEVKRRVLLERAEAEHQKSVRQLQMAREKITATMQEGKLSEAALLLEVATKRFAGDPEGWPVMVELKGRLDALRINDLSQQIRAAVGERDWLACEELVSRAERDYPGQEEWGKARNELRLGRRREQIEHLTTLVRPALTANDLATARRYLEASRDALAAEPVWQQLHDEIETKSDYNRDLAQAELLISRGDLDGAEPLLLSLTAGKPPDSRAAEHLAWIGRERAKAAKVGMQPVFTDDLPTVEMSIPPELLQRPSSAGLLTRKQWMISGVTLVVVLGITALAIQLLRRPHAMELQSVAAQPRPAQPAAAQPAPRPPEQTPVVEQVRPVPAAAKPAPDRQAIINTTPPQSGSAKPAAAELTREAYNGPSYGVMSWSGNLPASATLRFSKNIPDSGGLAGLRLPGNVPVSVEVMIPSGVTVVQQPSAANGWRGFVIRNESGAKLNNIQLRWQVR